MILREMFGGVTKFNRFEENVKGISSKMLALRLKELRSYGIVSRTIASGDPVQITYELTDKGRRLGPILLTAAQFSMTCLPQIVFRDGKPRTLERA